MAYSELYNMSQKKKNVTPSALAGHEVSRIVSCIVAKRADETPLYPVS